MQTHEQTPGPDAVQPIAAAPVPEPAPAPADPPKKLAMHQRPMRELSHDERIVERGNPFRGLRGLWVNLTQPIRLFFNPLAFYNIEQARKIVKNGYGTCYGFEDIGYVMPVITLSLIGWGVEAYVQNPIVSIVIGALWVLALALAVFTMGTDIGSRLVGAVIGVLFGVVAVCGVLEYTGTAHVAEGIWDIIKFFSPGFPVGTALLLDVLFLVMLIFAGIKSFTHQSLTTNGNKWQPARFATEATFDNSSHRVYATTPDWIERLIYGSRDIRICPILTAVKDQEELLESAAFILENVFGGRVVYSAIQYAMARSEVEERN